MSNRKAPSQLHQVEEYFGAYAREWQELYARPRRVNDLVLANRRRLAVEKVREHAAPGARVLDAGCGAGPVTLDLVAHGFAVHGVDIAQGMVDLAEQRFREAGVPRERYTFSRADVSRTGLAPGSFGAAVALGFLEYQADERAALQHFHELLEPGGVLVISGPTRIRLANYFGAAPRLRSELERLRMLEPLDGPRVGLHRYSPARLRSLLEAAGFETVSVQGHGFARFEGPLRRLPYRGELALHRSLSWLAERVPIDRWGNDLVAVARKPG